MDGIDTAIEIATPFINDIDSCTNHQRCQADVVRSLDGFRKNLPFSNKILNVAMKPSIRICEHRNILVEVKFFFSVSTLSIITIYVQNKLSSNFIVLSELICIPLKNTEKAAFLANSFNRNEEPFKTSILTTWPFDLI
mgnify:FL=1